MTSSPDAATQAAPRVGALDLVRRLQQAGFTAYWAGGCVRDELLGREPRDYDIATDAIPDAIGGLFPQARPVGRAFGVMLVPWHGHPYEIATFRHDHAYRDGRHPDAVTFSSPRDDAQRRDFTINALFYDPVADRLHDYANGRADLEQRILRCVGDPAQRFAEDHLRMLRAVRLAAVLDFALDPPTATAIRAHAPLLERISAERVRDELTRTLLEAPRPGDALLQMQALGLLAVILPEIEAMHEQAQPPEFHPEGDVLQHTALMLNRMRRRSVTLTYAVLLHDVGKPPTVTFDRGRIRFNRHDAIGAAIAATVLERLKLPRRVIEAVCAIVRQHMQFADVREMRPATRRRMLGRETFPLELELHRLDCLSSHRQLGHYRFLLAEQRRLRDTPPLPTPWLNGRDILAVGVSEGPAIGQWLRRAYDRQLDGTDADREAQLAWLRQAVNGS